MSAMLLLGSCKKETVYQFFVGDWNLCQTNYNGVITNYPQGSYDWAIYGCSGDPGGWCNGTVITTFPTPGNYSLNYQFSADTKWLITQGGSNIDSLAILTFTSDSLITLFTQPGIVETDIWTRD
jgi:hypothetical protein